MLVAQQAGIPQFMGSASARITAMGNPYIFRTSFGSQKSMPKIADYMEKEMGVEEGRRRLGQHRVRQGRLRRLHHRDGGARHQGRRRHPTENAQADFAADVVKAKNSDADAVFVYLTEEESARFLREAASQNVSQPLIGETTLIGQKVIELAGDAANGARGHVGLTTDAPNPQVQELAASSRRIRLRPRPQRHQGLYRRLRVKAATEKVGKFDARRSPRRCMA